MHTCECAQSRTGVRAGRICVMANTQRISCRAVRLAAKRASVPSIDLSGSRHSAEVEARHSRCCAERQRCCVAEQSRRRTECRAALSPASATSGSERLFTSRAKRAARTTAPIRISGYGWRRQERRCDMVREGSRRPAVRPVPAHGSPRSNLAIWSRGRPALESVPTNCGPRRTDTARELFGSCVCFVSWRQLLVLSQAIRGKCEARPRASSVRRRGLVVSGQGVRLDQAGRERGDRAVASGCSDVFTGAQYTDRKDRDAASEGT